MAPDRPLPRTAVTGVGVVAPGGVTRDAFWELITAGKTATRQITCFDPTGFRSQIAAEADFDPIAAGLSEHEARRMDRYVQFAAVAAMEAMNDAAMLLEEEDRSDVADGGLRPRQVDLDRARGRRPRAHGGHAGLGRGRHDRARGRLRGRLSNRGKEWLVDPAYAPPFLYARG